ncbi:MAG: hypothetical protein U0176_04655 [Bacteroidia bacterium]
MLEGAGLEVPLRQDEGGHEDALLRGRAADIVSIEEALRDLAGGDEAEDFVALPGREELGAGVGGEVEAAFVADSSVFLASARGEGRTLGGIGLVGALVVRGEGL